MAAPAEDEFPEPTSGVSVIDEEIIGCRRIARRVRELLMRFESSDRAIAAAEMAQEVEEATTLLWEYLYSHIMTEEPIMKEVGYAKRHPDLYSSHVEEHADIFEEMSELIFEPDFSSREFVLQLDLLAGRRVARHLRNHDLHFASFLARD